VTAGPLYGSQSMDIGTSYFDSRDPEHVVRDLERMKKDGLTFVVHTFSEHDAEFYFDTIKKLVKMTHDLGMKVYLDPWGVGKIFGGEPYSRLVMTHVMGRQMSADEKLLPAMCPNSPEFMEYMKKWVEMAAETGADYIFWDEPHFHRDGCYCDYCILKFDDTIGGSIFSAREDVRREFFEDSLVELMDRLVKLAHSKGLKNALCLLPRGDESYWRKFYEIRELDIIGTDPYWRGMEDDEFKKYFNYYTERVVRLGKEYGKEPQIWIQAFDVRSGEEWRISYAVKKAMDMGVKNFASWSFKGTPNMSKIRSDNPELVWKTYIEAFK